MTTHLPHIALKLALLDRGVESFLIQYDSPTCVYLPGEEIRGRAVIQLNDSIKARAVVISLIGKARTSWTVWEQYSSNRSTHSEAIPYSAEEIYADIQVVVWNNSETDRLNAGLHEFPFEFVIPENCPPSFESNTGFIRYYCKAKIDRPWKFDDSTRNGFTVLPYFDLNSVFFASLPLSKTFEKQLSYFCFKHGQLEAKVNLSKCGYVPGESMVLNVEIKNETTRDVIRIETTLLEIATFTAHRGRLHHYHYGLGTRHSDTEKKKESRTVVQYIEEFKVLKNSSGTYMRMLAIPPVVPSFDICEIIKVDYAFKIKIVTRGHFNRSISGEVPILIGTIPVRPVLPPHKTTVLTQDYLAPPQPSFFSKKGNSLYKSLNDRITYADSLFGKGSLNEDKDDRSVGFTPKYIFYKDLQ